MAQWFVWTMGAVSVEMYFGMIKAPRVTQSGAVAALALAVAGFTNWTYLYWMDAGLLRHVAWLATDYLWGLAFFAVVNATVQLESRASTFGRRLATIGFFSYSLYLSHEIITHGAWPALLRWQPGIGEWQAFLLIPLLLVACIGFAWVFFICFERPFLNRRPLPAQALLPQPLS
jgi:peptidoglycan/LPS O-acetylase OafA/YrhL